MDQPSPDAEKKLDARVYLKNATALPDSTTNGNVLYVATLVFPVVRMDGGATNAILRTKNLLEARFPGDTSQILYDEFHYEVVMNAWPKGHCIMCTGLAVFEVTIGMDVVVVEVRESVHYG